MDDALLFLVLLFIMAAVWFIDRLGRAAAKADQARRGLEAPPPLPGVPPPPPARATERAMRPVLLERALRPERAAAARPPARVAPPRLSPILRPPPRARRVSVPRARQAMVLMAIFGPCRGLQPLEQEPSSYGPPMGPISG